MVLISFVTWFLDLVGMYDKYYDDIARKIYATEDAYNENIENVNSVDEEQLEFMKSRAYIDDDVPYDEITMEDNNHLLDINNEYINFNFETQDDISKHKNKENNNRKNAIMYIDQSYELKSDKSTSLDQNCHDSNDEDESGTSIKNIGKSDINLIQNKADKIIINQNAMINNSIDEVITDNIMMIKRNEDINFHNNANNDLEVDQNITLTKESFGNNSDIIKNKESNIVINTAEVDETKTGEADSSFELCIDKNNMKANYTANTNVFKKLLNNNKHESNIQNLNPLTTDLKDNNSKIISQGRGYKASTEPMINKKADVIQNSYKMETELDTDIPIVIDSANINDPMTNDGIIERISQSTLESTNNIDPLNKISKLSIKQRTNKEQMVYTDNGSQANSITKNCRDNQQSMNNEKFKTKFTEIPKYEEDSMINLYDDYESRMSDSEKYKDKNRFAKKNKYNPDLYGDRTSDNITQRSVNKRKFDNEHPQATIQFKTRNNSVGQEHLDVFDTKTKILNRTPTFMQEDINMQKSTVDNIRDATKKEYIEISYDNRDNHQAITLPNDKNHAIKKNKDKRRHKYKKKIEVENNENDKTKNDGKNSKKEKVVVIIVILISMIAFYGFTWCYFLKTN